MARTKIFQWDGTDNEIILGDASTLLTCTPLTASLLTSTDASKRLTSVSDLTNWVVGTANQIVSTQSGGTAVLSLSSALAIPGKLTAGSFGSPIDVTNTREHGFELHYSGNNYNATAIRARAHAVTTDTSAQFQGALLQAANNDNINVGVLNGALVEAIGKATTNAATISMMRGCLVNTEWSAKDTVTDLRVLHVRTHTRDAAVEGYVSNSGHGIYIENEAVGGNGQALDTGIYFKGTNLSAGNKAFTYGMDFSGATYGTADIKLSNGDIINASNGRTTLSGLHVVTSIAGELEVKVRNTSTDTSAFSTLFVESDDSRAFISSFSSSYTNLPFYTNKAVFYGINTGDGTVITAPNNAGVISFNVGGHTSSNEIVKIDTRGLAFVNTGRINWTKVAANGAAVTGCTSGSNVTDLQTIDANIYTCSEVAATPNYLIVDFTGVTAFNWVEILGYYDGNATHNLVIQLEITPFDGTAWLTFDSIEYQSAATNTMQNHSFFVGSDTAYINSGVVRVRFLHSATEANGHTWGFNVVALHQ